MKMTPRGVWFKIIFAVGLFAAEGYAQAPPGAASVSGTVQDEQEAFVSGARILLTDTSRKVAREYASDRLGASCFRPSTPGSQCSKYRR